MRRGRHTGGDARALPDCVGSIADRMAMLPTIVVYVLAQRWSMEGVTRGAIT